MSGPRRIARRRKEDPKGCAMSVTESCGIREIGEEFVNFGGAGRIASAAGHRPSNAERCGAHCRSPSEAARGVHVMEDDWLMQAARMALWLDDDMSLSKADRLGFVRRRVSREGKQRIVAKFR